MLNLGVLASHQGTNFQAIIDGCTTGAVNARVSILISNNSGSGAMLRASKAGVATAHLSSASHPSEALLDEVIRRTLEQHHVDLVVLAGYMKKLGPSVIRTFRNRIINVHPSLLPRYGGHGFYGMNVHRAVLAAGDRETGATVHLVAGEYDTGAILAQDRIAVAADDTPETVAAKVREIEHRLLLQVINRFAEEGFHADISQ